MEQATSAAARGQANQQTNECWMSLFDVVCAAEAAAAA